MINTVRRCSRSGRRELTLKKLWGRSSALIPVNAPTRSRRTSTVASAIALAATTILGGCHHEAALPEKPPIAVRLADVTLYQSTEGLQYSASLIPYTQVDLAFRTTGYVTEVKQVKSSDGRARDIGTGDYIERGAVLAQIRQQDLKNQVDDYGAQVDAAIAQHTQAEQDFNRAKALYATQSLTKPEYDQAQARFDTTLAGINQAKAAHRQAQLSLGDSDLKAPFTGYILTRNIDVGTLASSSTAAFSIADISSVKATFGVPEDNLSLVRLGQALTGMIASVELGGKRSAPEASVPLSAVVPYPGATGRFAVVVAKENSGQWKADLRQVTVGANHGSSVSVTGVQTGEKVVVLGAQLLKQGDSLSVIP
jgi:multidrug efflux pump subunit AcrA (membrane-fusion protein)